MYSTIHNIIPGCSKLQGMQWRREEKVTISAPVTDVLFGEIRPECCYTALPLSLTQQSVIM
jgi:hypothetical protein